jgi:integration host factor subunit beta
MTRSDLIRTIARDVAVPQAMAQEAVAVVFAEIEAALAAGRRVELRGFGSFQVRRYESHPGHNPRTREQVTVRARYLPVFRAGRQIRDRLAGSGAPGA